MNEQRKSISRLPPLEEPPKDVLLAEIFAGIRVRGAALWNIHRVSGHAPKLFAATARYVGSLRNDVSLPPRLRELVILRTAQIAIPFMSRACIAAWRAMPAFLRRKSRR